MKFSITAALALLCLPSGYSLAQNQAQVIDQVIAIVDDDVVLSSEMTERLEQVKRNIEKSGQPAPPMDKIQRDLLDQLIVESIQRQMADRAGVRISDAQLNEAMNRIAAQNNMNLSQFRAALEADDMSYNNMREQIRNEMILQRVQQGNVNQRVQITDQEIDSFLESPEGQQMTSAEYHLLHALIPLSSDASPDTIAAAEAYANNIYQATQNGSSFKQAITEAGPMPIQTGDLGWRKASDMPSLFAEAGPKLAKGQISAPIRSASGYHLIYMEDKRGDGEIIPQAHARHILLKPSAIRDDKATEAEARELRERILAGEDFADLARQYSEDIGSAQEGGDLGWTSPGQMVPSFEETLAATAIDDVSPAFRSRFGWHILQVLERRDKDVTDDLRHNIARNYIHQRKFQDELQTWLQKIRDEAYVDIKHN